MTNHPINLIVDGPLGTHNRNFMTAYDLGLLPSGRLHCFPSNADDATDIAGSVGKAFTHDIGERLFTLAARRNSTGLSPSLQYWRNVARQ